MDKETIARYLRGTATEEEQQQVRQWLETQEEFPANLSHSEPQSKGEVLWEQLENRIQASRPFTPSKAFIRIAAAAILVLISFSCWWLFQQTEKAEITWKMVQIPAGKQHLVTLPDGSILQLAGNTQMSYPIPFNQVRQVRIFSGEVLIHAQHDPKRPFTAELGNGRRIRVLGTRFNIKQPQGRNHLELTLIDGKIAYEDQDKAPTILHPGEQLIQHEGNIQLNLGHAEQAIAWTKGMLWFEQAPIEEVFDQLESYYGIRFNGRNRVEAQQFTGKFERQTLDRVLQIISKSTNLHFIQKETNIEIVKNK